jgi:hypothetical protein
MCVFGYTRLLSPISYGKKLLLTHFIYFFARSRFPALAVWWFLDLPLPLLDHLQSILERDLGLQCRPRYTMPSSKRGLHAGYSSHTLHIKYTRFYLSLSLSLSSHFRHRYTRNFSPPISLLGCREGVDGTRSRRLREEVARANLRVKTECVWSRQIWSSQRASKSEDFLHYQCKLVMII